MEHLPVETQRQLDRCDREIQEIFDRPKEQGHWLMLMAIADWETEKRIILKKSIAL